MDHPLARKASCIWDASMLPRVQAFLYVSPLQDPLDSVDIELLTDPRIRRAVVWLDGIIGIYPNSFLDEEGKFWAYQLGLEKIARCPDFLCLSKSSMKEAVQFFGSEYAYAITRCLSDFKSVQAPQPPTDIPFQHYALTLGNTLPHKNIAAAVVGFAGAWRLGAALDGMVVNASLQQEQVDALRTLARNLGLPDGKLYFSEGLSQPTFANLLGAAQVLVIPSLHEGFSMPIIEALGVDVPVLISDIPAHRELLCHPDDFFSPTDPVSLCKKILCLLPDSEVVLRRQQQDLARLYRPEEFSRALLPVIESLIRPLAG
ncbi:glycosyltransferase [Kiritimatiellaeota bacterium B1221]|nr:glycosyltransferase [Kiritimatiellaeota bacterium B1221]